MLIRYYNQIVCMHPRRCLCVRRPYYRRDDLASGDPIIAQTISASACAISSVTLLQRSMKHDYWFSSEH